MRTISTYRKKWAPFYIACYRLWVLQTPSFEKTVPAEG
jgi:hypothetical protein